MVTVAEAARILGMSVRGIAHRLELGQMRGVKVNPRLWLIPAEEIERWKQMGKQRPGRKRQAADS